MTLPLSAGCGFAPRWLALLLVLLGGLAGPAQAAPGDLPSDLDLVPRDAAAFFHFRAKEL
jgi:hypothetical protein